jgi:magnesium transporter
VAQRIEELRSADAAAALHELPVERAAAVAEYLDPDTAGRILGEMEPARAAQIIGAMEATEAAMVLAAIEPDDRVDILEHVSGPLHDELLKQMDAPEAAQVRQLEQYPPDSAGGIMTPLITALPEDLTAQQAIGELRRMNEELEQMFYVYVVDRRGHLIGVLSMRDLILARPEAPLARIMRPNVTAVPATMDQEEVARIMRKYNYLALPVVDGRNRLVGLITVDDMVDVMEEEATEDVQKMFGAGAEERLTSPWQYSFRKRTWWLVVNLATAFLAGWVVSQFNSTISRLAVLAVYMPIVAGMGGNASAQAMSVSIRGLATGRPGRDVLFEVMHRELVVGILTGILIGLITGVVALLWQHNPMLGVVVAMALIINHILACTSGAGIPFAMKRLGFDPAQSATIFATTVTDVCGFFSLLGLAYLFMRWLV